MCIRDRDRSVDDEIVLPRNQHRDADHRGSPQGDGITDGFIDYALPLIQGHTQMRCV